MTTPPRSSYLVVLALGILLGGLVAGGAGFAAVRKGWVGAGPRPSVLAASGDTAVDWSRVSTRDLNVASLFLTTREQGVRRAMDSLQVLATRDPRIFRLGHIIAHGLGRFAASEQPGEPRVFGECTAAFWSGCYHGVLEGYAASRSSRAPLPVETLCASMSGPEQPPYAAQECAHGVGHALMDIHKGVVTRVLKDCERLPSARDVRDCAEGAYMEEKMRGPGQLRIDAGDATTAHRAHVHAQGSSGGGDEITECNGAPAAHRAACWVRVPSLIYGSSGGDAATILRACRRAADAPSVQACRRGFGHREAFQSSPLDASAMAAACAADGADAIEACVDGAVDYLVDIDWRPERAGRFCAGAPDSIQVYCYRSLGSRLALLSAGTDSARAYCDRARPILARACQIGLASAVRRP
jgi:hypothetical protein